MRHARYGLLLAGLRALGLAAWAPGCLFAPDDCTDLLKCPGVGTGGNSSSATSSGSMGSAGGDSTSATSTGAGAECTVATETTDCSAPSTICGEPACVNGVCWFKNAQEGKTPSQVYGDCHDSTCHLAQPASEVNDADVYDDANDCTEDLCANGVPSNMPRPAGVACSNNGAGKVCDGKGACVGCTSNTDCTEPLVCHEGACVPLTCFDTMSTPAAGETDIDCGGKLCAPCADTKICSADTDCQSGICRKPAGQLTSKCIPAACDDKVKNGKETAKDCGGPACKDRCSPGDTCLVPGDCISGVCVGGQCKAATCTDGVKNANETGIDCGANCPACIGN